MAQRKRNAHAKGWLTELKRSLLAGLWFMFLTFPILCIKVDTINDTITWRFQNLIYIGVSIFFLSYVWRFSMARKQYGTGKSLLATISPSWAGAMEKGRRLFGERKVFLPLALVVCVGALMLPQFVNFYQTTILVKFMIWIMLGLGLNIVIGLAGLLDLGFVAFYAVGAYAYALLDHHFGISFWAVLPGAMFLGALCGVLLGYPVLRLRGDYLAIVTLGFGEIIRLVLENWGSFTMGPSGISGIARPPLFGVEMGAMQATTYMYYIMIGLLIFTIFVVNRLKNSRIGRAWEALKEDEVACQAMGIDKAKTKLTAFALGATWAAMGGVCFAANIGFINPGSFTLMESIVILSIVVVGGMGSIPGVMLGALVLVLLPEWLRGLEQFRMLAFGGFLVLIMVFRPQGLISAKRRSYEYKEEVTVDD